MSMKNFIKRYHKESIYMVDNFPYLYTKDVLMPAPLRCENTREFLRMKNVWLSKGGTKSVLHFDTSENINCLFRGKWFDHRWLNILTKSNGNNDNDELKYRY